MEASVSAGFRMARRRGSHGLDERLRREVWNSQSRDSISSLSYLYVVKDKVSSVEGNRKLDSSMSAGERLNPYANWTNASLSQSQFNQHAHLRNLLRPERLFQRDHPPHYRSGLRQHHGTSDFRAAESTVQDDGLSPRNQVINSRHLTPG